MDYEETLSSVVRFALVRLILATITKNDLELYQMIFLNRELEEEFFMDQTIRFEIEGQGCKFASSDVLYTTSNNH